MPYRLFAFLIGAFVLLSGQAVQADAWHAYVKAEARTARPKADIASLMRSGNAEVLRVRPETIMAQVAEVLGRGNWESPTEFGDWLNGAHVTEVACTPELLRNLRLARTNASGTKFDFNWRRDRCDPGEKFLVYNGQIFMSNSCLNVVPKREPLKVAVAPKLERCPGGFVLQHHFWDGGRLRRDLAEKATHLTKQEQQYRSAAVSRTIGGQLRQCAIAGQCGRVPNAVATVRLLNPDGSIHREVGEIRADASGVGTMVLPTGEAESKTISVVFDSVMFISPPVGGNNIRELRSFPKERQLECRTNTHSIFGVVRVAQAP